MYTVCMLHVQYTACILCVLHVFCMYVACIHVYYTYTVCLRGLPEGWQQILLDKELCSAVELGEGWTKAQGLRDDFLSFSFVGVTVVRLSFRSCLWRRLLPAWLVACVSYLVVVYACRGGFGPEE